MTELPIDTMLKAWGPDRRLSEAAGRLRCSACLGVGAEAYLARLCRPGCGEQRG